MAFARKLLGPPTHNTKAATEPIVSQTKNLNLSEKPTDTAELLEKKKFANDGFDGKLFPDILIHQEPLYGLLLPCGA